MLRASGGMKKADEYDLDCALHPAKTTARDAMHSNRDADARKCIMPKEVRRSFRFPAAAASPVPSRATNRLRLATPPLSKSKAELHKCSRNHHGGQDGMTMRRFAAHCGHFAGNGARPLRHNRGQPFRNYAARRITAPASRYKFAREPGTPVQALPFSSQMRARPLSESCHDVAGVSHASRNNVSPRAACPRRRTRKRGR
jgi:hypothetical protein